jgi:hypothetical protein
MARGRRGIGKEVDNFAKTFMQMWKLIQRDREIELREARRNAPKEMSASERARYEEEQAVKKAGDEGERAAGFKTSASGRGYTDTGAPLSLVSNESGGSWTAQNDAEGAGGKVGHFGRVQFGQARLEEAKAAGVIPRDMTPAGFMRDPEAQKAAERWHFNDIRNFIKSNGYDKLAGKTIGGTPVTEDGMLAVAHLGGKGGLKQFIETEGRYNPNDINGTRLSDYFSRHRGGGYAGSPSGDAGAIPTDETAGTDQYRAEEDLGAQWDAEDQADMGAGNDEELYFADGGAVPGWSSKGPNAQGSVFLDYARQNPRPAPAPRISAPAAPAAPASPAAPATPGTRSGDRFRALKAERANRPTTPTGYQFDGNQNQLWTAMQQNRDASGIPKYPGERTGLISALAGAFEAGGSGDNASDAERAEYFGGLRMDPSGKYAIRPPAINASQEEKQAYLSLPKATGELDVLRGVNWRKAIDDDYLKRAEEAASRNGAIGNLGDTWGRALPPTRAYAEGGLVEDDPSPAEALPIEPVRDTAPLPPAARMPRETPAPAPAREAVPVSAPPMEDVSNSNSGGSGAGAPAAMAGYDPQFLVNPEGVSKAVQAGFDHLQRAFGFDQQRAAIPGTDPQREQAVAAFANNEGAPTAQEIKTIDKTIDPEGKLTPEVRSLARMYGVYKLYEARGDMRGAAQMAGAMMLHSRRVLSTGGVVVERMIRAGNLPAAAKAGEEAYNEGVPDGQRLKVTPEKGGQFKMELFDQDGQLTQQGRYGVDQLLKFATGMQNGTVWFQKFGEIAQGGGSGSRAPAGQRAQRTPTPTAEERSLERDAARATGAIKATAEEGKKKRAEINSQMAIPTGDPDSPEFRKQAELRDVTVAVPRGGPADAADRRADQTRQSVKTAEGFEQSLNVLDAKFREQTRNLGKDSVARRERSSDEQFAEGLGASAVGKAVADKMPAAVKGSLIGVARTALAANDISDVEAGRVVGDMYEKGLQVLGDGSVRPKGSQERGIYLDGRSVRAIEDARNGKADVINKNPTTSVKNTTSLADAILESRRMGAAYSATGPKPKAAGPENKSEADKRMNNRRADAPAPGATPTGPEQPSPARRVLDRYNQHVDWENSVPAPEQPPPMNPQQRFDNTQDYIRRRRSAVPVN